MEGRIGLGDGVVRTDSRSFVALWMTKLGVWGDPKKSLDFAGADRGGGFADDEFGGDAEDGGNVFAGEFA